MGTSAGDFEHHSHPVSSKLSRKRMDRAANKIDARKLPILNQVVVVRIEIPAPLLEQEGWREAPGW